MPERIIQSIQSLPGFHLAMMALFGAWGGAVRHLHDVSLSKRKFSWTQLIIQTVISGFFGLMLGFLAMHYEYDLWMTWFAAGVGGGMGMKTLDIILWYVKSRRLVLVDPGKEGGHPDD